MQGLFHHSVSQRPSRGICYNHIGPNIGYKPMMAIECQIGMSVPLDLRIRRILLPASKLALLREIGDFAMKGVDSPVTTFTCAIPCESLRTTPICDGVAPFFASLQI